MCVCVYLYRVFWRQSSVHLHIYRNVPETGVHVDSTRGPPPLFFSGVLFGTYGRSIFVAERAQLLVYVPLTSPLFWGAYPRGGWLLSAASCRVFSTGRESSNSCCSEAARIPTIAGNERKLAQNMLCIVPSIPIRETSAADQESAI